MIECMFVFCFFKQKTAYEMRSSDWSSDVCSSDLHVEVRIERELRAAHRLPQPHVIAAALLRRLQEGVVGEVQSTRLQVGLAGRRLGRHQGAADDVEDEALGIGELLPGSVDAVVVRIARGDEAGGRLDRKSTRLNSSH